MQSHLHSTASVTTTRQLGNAVCLPINGSSFPQFFSSFFAFSGDIQVTMSAEMLKINSAVA